MKQYFIFNERRRCDYHIVHTDDTAPTVTAKYGTGGGNVPFVLSIMEYCGKQYEDYYKGECKKDGKQ